MSHWAVSVERDGQNIVTIESNWLSGRDLSAEDEETILGAAQSLLSFIGQPPSNPSLLADLQEAQRQTAALRAALEQQLIWLRGWPVTMARSDGGADVPVVLMNPANLEHRADTLAELLAAGTETP